MGIEIRVENTMQQIMQITTDLGPKKYEISRGEKSTPYIENYLI